jgi:hypothetical protein
MSPKQYKSDEAKKQLKLKQYNCAIKIRIQKKGNKKRLVEHETTVNNVS